MKKRGMLLRRAGRGEGGCSSTYVALLFTHGLLAGESRARRIFHCASRHCTPCTLGATAMGKEIITWVCEPNSVCSSTGHVNSCSEVDATLAEHDGRAGLHGRQGWSQKHVFRFGYLLRCYSTTVRAHATENLPSYHTRMH